MEDCEVFICKDCEKQKSFAKRYQYNQHMKSHEKPYRCTFCKKAFSKKADLERHRMTHISSPPKFKCRFPGCPFSGTSRIDYLRSHIKQRHSSPNAAQDQAPKTYYTELDANEKQQSINSMQELAFLEAVAQGDEEELIQLLPKSSMKRISIKDSGGGSVLHVAARAGNTNTAKFLLQNGADATALDNKRQSVLHYAVQGGHKSVAELLIQNGADANALDNKRQSVLHHAAQGGHKSVAELLIQNGADVNALDFRGKSALVYAAQGEHEGVIELLLRNEACINARAIWDTVLYRAVMRGHITTVRLLLDRGAKVNIRASSFGVTPLHAAVRTNPEMTKLLLQSNAAIEAKDYGGLAPLSYAIGRDNYEINEFIEQTTMLLLEAGANFSKADWDHLSPDRKEQLADYCPYPLQ